MAVIQQVRGLLLRGRIDTKVINFTRTFVSAQRERPKHVFRSSSSSTEKKLIPPNVCNVTSASLKTVRLPSASAAVLYQSAKHCSSSPATSDVVTTRLISSKQASQQSNYMHPFNPDLVDDLLSHMDGDLPPPEMTDPFAKDYRRCFLCRHNVQLDHKNVRLLSQFVSPYTGRIYGRAVTGLCIPMQKRVAHLIKRARRSGFMPVLLKDSKYLHDPQPYEPMSKKT